MKLTSNQKVVLCELSKICRANAIRQQGKSEYLYKQDLERLSRGDEACTFGLGGLTFQVSHRLGMTTGSVLSTFKAMERKGLIIRETRAPEYQRPLYWWPVGLSAELYAELTKASHAEGGKV